MVAVSWEVTINVGSEVAGRTYQSETLRARDAFTGRTVEIDHAGGIIAAIRQADHGQEREALPPWLGPGLVDLQINGAHGHDFNEASLDTDTVSALAPLLAQHGITAYFPTLVTTSDKVLLGALNVLARSCQEAGTSGLVAGIHLEGPFISPETGPRGAHDATFVGPPDWDRLQAWQNAARGMIRIITLSPEWPGSTEFIERCVESQILVSIGHTAATPEQIRDAVAAGARMSTHLGNGMHTHIRRHPNYLWEQLADDQLAATVIADGFHLPLSVLSVILRAKGERALLISDAVGLSGLPAGAYDRHIGGRVVLTDSGRLHLADQPDLLAGSVAMLPACIAHLTRHHLTTLGGAWRMASTGPAATVDLPVAQGLTVGAPADMVLFDWDGSRITVLTTIKAGQVSYRTAGMR